MEDGSNKIQSNFLVFLEDADGVFAGSLCSVESPIGVAH
jgi:hypothetical protein